MDKTLPGVFAKDGKNRGKKIMNKLWKISEIGRCSAFETGVLPNTDLYPCRQNNIFGDNILLEAPIPF